MGWQPLQSRATHIAWGDLEDLAVDPYIAWADCVAFTGARAALLRAGQPLVVMRATPASTAASHGSHDPTLPVAFEVCLPLPKTGPPAYKKLKKIIWPPHAKVGTRFATSAIHLSDLALFFDPFVQRYFPRVELGLPMQAPANAIQFAASLSHSTTSAERQVFAAVIDDGCAFANEAFITTRWPQPPKSRIAHLWFQEDRSVAGAPSTVGFTGADLDAMLAAGTARGRLDEAACYDALEGALRSRSAGAAADSWKKQMRANAAHGTHVLDVVAGHPNPLARRYRYGTASDWASAAPIVFVQLPSAAVADTSGMSMSVNVLEALAYIGGVIGPAGKVVVNLSYGALAGPHDGSTLLEEAMDDLLAHDERFGQIVLPAGNGYDSRTHASIVASNDARWTELHVRLLPDDPTDTFVELWYAPCNEAGKGGDAVIDVEFIAPDGSTSRSVPVGSFVELGEGGLPTAAVLHTKRPTSGGGSKQMALLAVAPTRTDPAIRPSALHGLWTVRLRNRGGLPVAVDAWIERDDSPFGSGRSRSQAVFVSQGKGSAPGGPHAATTPITRQACLNSFAHGERTLIAAGCSLRPPIVAKYSASGPGRKGAIKGPNTTAPCEDTPGSAILAAGTRSSQPAYMNGTSVAAAVLSRQCLNDPESRASSRGPRRPPDSDPEPLQPRPERHPDGATYPDPALRRGAGLLKPFP